MGKLVDGNRVTSFAPNDSVRHDTFLNEIQDQLIGVIEEREFELTSLFNSDDSANNWYWSGTAWYTPINPNNNQMDAILPVRAGEKIVKIDITYKGSNRIGGEIALYSEQLITVGDAVSPNAPSKLFDLGENATNPWQPTSNPTNYHRIQTTVNTIIQVGYSYKIKVNASTTGAGAQESFWNCKLHIQFGN